MTTESNMTPSPADTAALVERLKELFVECLRPIPHGLRVFATVRELHPQIIAALSVLAETQARLAEADAVINYDTARNWPRYGLEAPILKAGEDTPLRSAAMKRHHERHASRPSPPAAAAERGEGK